MGAFFLYKKDTDINSRKALSVFDKKGFTEKFVKDIGNYRLIIFRKILIHEKNY